MQMGGNISPLNGDKTLEKTKKAKIPTLEEAGACACAYARARTFVDELEIVTPPRCVWARFCPRHHDLPQEVKLVSSRRVVWGATDKPVLHRGARLEVCCRVSLEAV